MRTELQVAINDTAQPTEEEIKEFQSFSSKYLLLMRSISSPKIQELAG